MTLHNKRASNPYACTVPLQATCNLAPYTFKQHIAQHHTHTSNPYPDTTQMPATHTPTPHRCQQPTPEHHTHNSSTWPNTIHMQAVPDLLLLPGLSLPPRRLAWPHQRFSWPPPAAPSVSQLLAEHCHLHADHPSCIHILHANVCTHAHRIAGTSSASCIQVYLTP